MRSLSQKLTLVFLMLLGAAVCASAQSVTFTGRVTDQSTGQGIADVAVVALGNQSGTRVAVTDAQGNYSVTLGANTDVFLRAYKSTYIFNPLSSEFVSFGGFPIVGTITRNLTGTSFPFSILLVALPPILLTEDNSLNALTVDDVTHTRDPFPLTNDNYFGSDKRTRLTLLLVDLELFSGETLSIITAQAVDAQSKTYSLAVEDLRKVPNVPWLSQLTVRLPSELVDVTSVTITVSARGQVSNGAKVKLK